MCYFYRVVVATSELMMTLSAESVMEHQHFMIGCTWASWPYSSQLCIHSLQILQTREKGKEDINVIEHFLCCDTEEIIELTSHTFLCHFSGLLILLHICSFVECAVAAILTLYVVEPVGSLHVVSCPAERLSDWYTMLYNPSPDYVNTLHCTSEAVCPL